MKSSYWQERFLQEEEKRNKDARAYLSSIEKQYDMALRDIEKDINDWYVRIAKNNEITLREAKMLLSKNELKEFHWTLEDYIEKGKENAVSQEWIKELENASAKTHISKLEALKVQIQNEIEGLYGERLKGMENYLERVYKDNYYRTAFTIQKGLEIGWSLAILDTNKINQIIHKPWAIDGKNFSERIWEDKTKLINTLHTGLTQNIIRGFAPDNLIKQISKEFGVKKSIAGRLVMTESAAYSSKAQEKCFKDLGVEKYEIVATLDTSTSVICREMDGKIFDMKDYQVGITANPFHPNCRTVTAPYFEDDTNSMRAIRTEEGKTEYVPANMKYEEWYKKYVMKESVKSDIIIENTKIKSTMETEDYNSYMELLNKNSNKNIQELYINYSNDISNIIRTTNGGAYNRIKNTIDYSYATKKHIDEGMSKYSTLAHEFGHYFDNKEFYENLTFKEVNTLNEYFDLGTTKLFKVVPSSSDEFLEALQKDKEILRKNFMKWKADINTTPGAGVQDALDGMFGTQDEKLTNWGHGNKYYNRKYNSSIKGLGLEKELKKVYQILGYEIKNQNQVKAMCRKYETASEAWANICGALTCGGKELEYTKKYLPNMYEAFLRIIKNVKKGV